MSSRKPRGPFVGGDVDADDVEAIGGGVDDSGSASILEPLVVHAEEPRRR